MLGCHVGRNFQVTVAGGSYQDSLTAVLQNVSPSIALTEQEVYGDLLLRKRCGIPRKHLPAGNAGRPTRLIIEPQVHPMLYA